MTRCNRRSKSETRFCTSTRRPVGYDNDHADRSAPCTRRGSLSIWRPSRQGGADGNERRREYDEPAGGRRATRDRVAERRVPFADHAAEISRRISEINPLGPPSRVNGSDYDNCTACGRPCPRAPTVVNDNRRCKTISSSAAIKFRSRPAPGGHACTRR